MAFQAGIFSEMKKCPLFFNRFGLVHFSTRKFLSSVTSAWAGDGKGLSMPKEIAHLLFNAE